MKIDLDRLEADSGELLVAGEKTLGREVVEAAVSAGFSNPWVAVATVLCAPDRLPTLRSLQGEELLQHLQAVAPLVREFWPVFEATGALRPADTLK